MLNLIINNFDKIAGAILFSSFGGYVTYRIWRKNRFAEACIKFRHKVLSALEGIYPEVFVYVPTNEINTRIRQSIPIVVTAATEFKYHLPFYRKGSFGNAVNHYTDTARQTNWDSHIAYLMYPSMHKPGGISPGDKFKHSVKNLLSYAKEK